LLRVSATNNVAGEVFYLADRAWAEKNLRYYAQRWSIENLYTALKAGAFNLEDTGLTRTERIATLMDVTLLGLVYNVLNFENGKGVISIDVFWQNVIRGVFLMAVLLQAWSACRSP